MKKILEELQKYKIGVWHSFAKGYENLKLYENRFPEHLTQFGSTRQNQTVPLAMAGTEYRR